MLVHHYLRDSARQSLGKPAIIIANQAHSFQEIDEASDRLASGLQGLGVRRGDRVATMLDNSIEMVISLWASLNAGAVFVPIRPCTKADKLGLLLAGSGATGFIVATHLRQRVKEVTTRVPFSGPIIWVGCNVEAPGLRLDEILARPHKAPTDPGLIDQDLCLIIYTSGSTGSPKGVMMTHRSICNNLWSISTYLRNQSDDVILSVLPLSFV